MSQQAKAYLFAITTVLLWSTVATAFKFSLQYLDVFQLLFIACLTSAITLLLILLLQGKFSLLAPTLIKHPGLSLLNGCLNPVFYYLILFAAYDRLPAQVAQPINYTWAIMLSLMSIVFLKQKIRFVDFLAAGICYIGVVIIASQGELAALSGVNVPGVALALLSTVIWAGYWILNVRDPRESTTAMTLNFLVALPITAMLWWFFSDSKVPLPGLAGAVYTGLFEMSLSFLCWSLALKYSENTARVSNLIFLSPFLSLVFIHEILGESIYSTTYIGLVIIIVGLIVQQGFYLHRRSAQDALSRYDG